MSKIKDGEPGHWHSESGKHTLPDPRRVYERNRLFGEPVVDVPRRLWDADEWAYAEHLEAHGIGVDDPRPEPQEDDPTFVKLLFAKIENNEQQNKIMRELITTIREAGRTRKEAAAIEDGLRGATE